jgi:PQQ-dependent catabolism-associated CXXCW motif protein
MSSKVLFYCMMDCWMSWNAAKRAIEWGYSSVLWYPLGADGWEFEGLPLAENRPSGNMR